MITTYVFNVNTGMLEELETLHVREGFCITVADPFRRKPQVMLAGSESNDYLKGTIGQDDYSYHIETLLAQQVKLKQLAWLLGHHAGNTETFGPAESYRLMWTTRREDSIIDFGLCITAPAFLRALKVKEAAVGIGGDVFHGGQTMSVIEFVRDVQDKACDALAAFQAGTIRTGVTNQWQAAIDDTLTNILAHLELRSFKDATPQLGDTQWWELFSLQDVLGVLDIASTTLSRYRNGEVPGHKPPFPDPVRFKGRTPYWTKDQIRHWRDASI